MEKAPSQESERHHPITIHDSALRIHHASAAAGEIMEMRVAPCLAQSLLMRLPAGPFEIRGLESTPATPTSCEREPHRRATTSMRLGRGSASPWTAAPDLPFLCQVLLVVIALAIAGLSHAQSNFACENCDDLKEAGTPMTMRASE